MVEKREHEFSNSIVEDGSPLTVYSYTFPNTSSLVGLSAKFTIYDVDQGGVITQYFIHSYIISNITTAPVGNNPDSNFVQTSGTTSLSSSIVYNQTTGVIDFIIINGGSFSNAVACKWTVELQFLL